MTKCIKCGVEIGDKIEIEGMCIECWSSGDYDDIEEFPGKKEGKK